MAGCPNPACYGCYEVIAIQPADLPFRTDREALDYLREIVECMMTNFGITAQEAIGRIAKAWSNLDSIVGHDDLMYHELPSYWAHHFYFGKSSFWWIAAEKRKEMGLPVLKPIPIEDL